MSDHPFFQLKQIDGVFVISLMREVTGLDEQEFRSAESTLLSTLAESKPQKVLVDFSAVRYFSSRGIGLLIRIHKRAVEAGGKTAICGLSENSAAVVTASRMDVLMDVYTNCEEAIDALKSSD